MALLKNIVFKGTRMFQTESVLLSLSEGEANIDCYVIVSHINGDKNNVSFVAEYKENSTKRTLLTKTFSFIPSVENDSENFIRQSYQYLKSLSEFSGAIDVLEEGQAV